MNVSRGLFRAWIVISIIWIVGAAVFGYATVVPDAVHGDFQAVGALKVGVKPSDIHSDRPFYDMIRSPSIEKLTVAFRLLDWQTKNDFDQDTHMIKTDFPDGSHLYMSEFYSIADQKYIAGEFWAQRWWRWARAIETIAPWALVPCVLLFILGYAFLWIGRGFARA